MRNYFKLNVSLVTQTDVNTNTITGFWFWHEDDPDYLNEMIARQNAYTGFVPSIDPTIQTKGVFMKLNLQEIMDALNLPGGAGTAPAVLEAWLYPGLQQADYEELIRAIFVDKSPRKKE